MDFVFVLSKTKQWNTEIFVDVDRSPEKNHFMPIASSQSNAKDIAQLHYKEMPKHHGILRKIISDRDTRFASTFWMELMKLLQVKLNLSTALCPQTDGKQERTSRPVESMLRCFVHYIQNDLDEYPPGVELTYNNHKTELAKQTVAQTPLFFLLFGHLS